MSCGHVGDSLEYSAFPGGYFTPEGVFYYITDWQGNNIAVFSDKGALVQQTTYYPYGEPTIEPTGQRYLFGGKEREHAGGSELYNAAIDFSNSLHELLENNELTFVGHSMGGGCAAAASMETGCNSITFNPAALSNATIEKNHLGESSKIINYRTVPKVNGTYRIGGCFVNNFQDNIGMRAPGKTKYIEINGHNPFSAHGIKTCLKYIKR